MSTLLRRQADANSDGQVDMNDLRELVRELQRSSGTTNVSAFRACDELGRLHVAVERLCVFAQVDLSELSDEARQTLISSAAGRDGSGHHTLSSNSPLEPIRMRLRETDAGESILRGLDSNGDTEISAQELAVAWTSLRSLAQNPGESLVHYSSLIPSNTAHPESHRLTQRSLYA